MRLSKSVISEREAEAVRKVLLEDGYLGMGAVTARFEKAVAKYLGVSDWQTISVNSGTAALHLACQTVKEESKKSAKLAKNGKKAEILVPSLTFVASFQAIRAAGCIPVACDVLHSTGTLDLEDAKKRLTESTIAVMHVDYASNPWHLDKVYEFAKENGLRMIDDAAHAFGCKHHGRKIGSFGDLVCFSFDGIKNITCGEGGMVVAFKNDSAKAIADARLLGVEEDSLKRTQGKRTWDPEVSTQGWRYHLSNIMAAIGIEQLERLEKEFIPARSRLYQQYLQNLKNCPHLEFFETDPEDFIVPHIMPVKILDGFRNQLQEILEKNEIPVGMHYKPNHLLKLFGKGNVHLPISEKLYSELITLPLHPDLNSEDIKRVCETITGFLGSI